MKVEMIKENVELYPHQLEAVGYGLATSSLLIADDMGLGKTLEALTIAAVDFQRGMAEKVLVVCPASLKFNWAEEIRRLTNFTCRVLDGNPAQRTTQISSFDANILIVNYEQVVLHLDELNEVGFDIVVFDEAHYIKNSRSKRTKACHRLRARRFIPMTGTPLMNKVDDLWSLLHVVAPRRFPNYWAFRNQYCVMGGYKNKQVVGVKNKNDLLDKLSKVMIRREKEDVLKDLPSKTRVPLYVDLHPEQKKLYDEVLSEWQFCSRDGTQHIPNAMVQLMRLKQICSTTYTLIDYDHSAKLNVAVERAEEVVLGGKPVVVFTNYRKTLEAFGHRWRGEPRARPITGHGLYEIHGDQTPEERQQRVAAWKRSEAGVLVAMQQVAGVGLNLTEADTCIFVDKDWSPAVNRQAEDRLHRIGQDENVTIIDIIAYGTIESRVEQILAEKTELSKAIVDGAVDIRHQLAEELHG